MGNEWWTLSHTSLSNFMFMNAEDWRRLFPWPSLAPVTFLKLCDEHVSLSGIVWFVAARQRHTSQHPKTIWDYNIFEKSISRPSWAPFYLFTCCFTSGKVFVSRAWTQAQKTPSCSDMTVHWNKHTQHCHFLIQSSETQKESFIEVAGKLWLFKLHKVN